MSVWGVAMVRDEEDVIEQTIRHMRAEGVAGCVVLDNASRDGTRAILDGLAGEWPGLHVVDDPEPGYWQAAKMTSAMRRAGELGAEWVIPFDADEIWYSESGRSLADAVLVDGNSANALWAVLYNHFATGRDPVVPSQVDDPFSRMGWRQAEPGALPKIAVRVADTWRIEMGNHSARLRSGQAPAQSSLRIRHFPYRSPGQMIRKVRNGAAAYRATTLDEKYGLHWRQMGEALDEGGEAAIEAWYFDAFFYAEPDAAGLVFDPAPVAREAAL